LVRPVLVASPSWISTIRLPKSAIIPSFHNWIPIRLKPP
jgi:hypothetical protein